MKNTRLIATLCAALTALLCTSCTSLSSTETTPPTETGSISESDRADYEARISQLRESILDLKEEGFITKAEYEARIKALTEEIAALESRLSLMSSPSTGDDLPVGGKPTDTTRETTPDTSPSTNTPSSIAFHYEIREGQAVILSYLGKESCVTIPATIGGYPVTSIEEAAFRATPVSTVVIPASVTKIGWFAFADCKSLASVTLPASVSTIGYGAFDGCSSVTLYCPSDSYAANYAASFGLRYKHQS